MLKPIKRFEQEYFNQLEYTIIGDVHGKVDKYKQALFDAKYSIQLGDFGFMTQHKWHMDNIDSSKHKISFGNHDHTAFLKMDHSLDDWAWFPKLKLMTIRGGFSIDRQFRTEGRDWFVNEEISYLDLDNIISIYAELKPDIVISHVPPQSIKSMLYGYEDKQRTDVALDAMLLLHKPHKWIYGHMHISGKEIIKGTEFICLAELETYVLKQFKLPF